MTYVRIDMADIDTCELVDELNKRKEPIPEHTRFLQFSEAINFLYSMGCPISLLRPIEDWHKLPEANALKLKEWKELCEIKENGL